MEWLTIASTVFGVVKSISGGNQQASQYEAAAQANQYNAAIARQRADVSLASASAKEDDFRRRTRIIQGRQRAAIAQSGTGFGGSNADIERQSMVAAELDAMNIRYEGQLESQGLLSQASIDEHSAGISKVNASTTRTSGFMGAAGAVLSGAGDYLKLNRKNPEVRPSLYGNGNP
jgi:hypothetical protein